MSGRAHGGASRAGRRAPGLFSQKGRARVGLQQVPGEDGEGHPNAPQGTEAKVSEDIFQVLK